MNLEVVLGVWAGLYLDGEVISQANLQPYIDDVMNELEFLTVSRNCSLPILSISDFKTGFNKHQVRRTSSFLWLHKSVHDQLCRDWQ